jgi:taurine-pyruvate aminotransferase
MNPKRGSSVVGETQKKWQEKDRRYVWHAMSGHDPSASTMIVEKGDGAWITDTAVRS